MPIALAPEEKSLRVFPTFAEKGDDAVGQLAEGHRVEGRGVEPDEERVVARHLARYWRFKVGCRKFTDGGAVRPVC
jgi:hypothetical protein